jgi:hypothetical protein
MGERSATSQLGIDPSLLGNGIVEDLPQRSRHPGANRLNRDSYMRVR